MMKHKLTRYRFDDVLVEPDSYRVLKSGQVLPLEPKAFEVLILLIENAGLLVSKDEMLNSVWNNSFVTPNAMTRVIAQLRKVLGDRRKEPRYIQTVQTRGYRFIAEVEVVASWSPTIGEPEFSSPKTGTVTNTLNSAPLIPSLAVLPLKNLSPDLQNEYFTEGLTEELITVLARLGLVRVVSRTSVMQYKSAQRSLPQIAMELNADMVLEGSVLQVGDRVRITAQLIRGRDDQHLWAEIYERTIIDVFDLQREIAVSILNQVYLYILPQAEEKNLPVRAAG